MHEVESQQVCESGQVNGDAEECETARALFESFLGYRWSDFKKDRRRQEMLREISELKQNHPGLFEEVYKEMFDRAKRAWEQKTGKHWR